MTNNHTSFICKGARSLFPAAILLFVGSALAEPTRPAAYLRPSERAVQSLTKPADEVVSWQPRRFGLAAEIRTTWPQNGAARRLAGKNAPVGGGLSLHYDAWRPSSRLVAKVDFGWTSTSTNDIQAATQNSESLHTNLLSVGLSLRYQIFRWLAPYARLAGGVGWDKLQVGSPTGQMHDERAFGHGSVGGGIFLRSPGVFPRPSWTWLCLALMGHIEGGYMVASGSSFSLQSSPASGVANPVPTASVPIGEVGRNAPYLRVSVGVAF